MAEHSPAQPAQPVRPAPAHRAGAGPAVDAPAQLEVSEISLRFGGLQALADVSIVVPASTVTGLIGPNGAGKTTLFNVMTGLYRPDGGRVRLDGTDITRLRPHVRARLGIARTFQRLELFGSLSAQENVELALEVARRRRPQQPALEEILELTGIRQVAGVPADLLPTGLARLVELARAIASSPRLLLLDEPGSGLSTAETDELAGVLVRLRDQGMGILLVEHDMRLVMAVCDRVTVLDFGRVIAAGAPSEVQADPAVRSAYLGDDVAGSGRPPAPIVTREVTAPEAATGREVVPGAESTTAPPALALEGIRAGYGRIEVLHDVSLRVERGTVYALVGPNGAGKSTLLRVLSGRLRPTAGRILVDGRDLGRVSPRGLVRRGVCTVPEGRGIFPNLTVAENLLMHTHWRAGLRRSEVEARAYEMFPMLGERPGELAGRLSGGQQQMLAFARAVSTGAGILLLDELSMGLAPLVVADLYDRLRTMLADRELTILLVEQFAHAALSLAQRAGVMVNGRIALEGTPAEVEAGMAAAYLGASSP